MKKVAKPKQRRRPRTKTHAAVATGKQGLTSAARTRIINSRQQGKRSSEDSGLESGRWKKSRNINKLLVFYCGSSHFKSWLGTSPSTSAHKSRSGNLCTPRVRTASPRNQFTTFIFLILFFFGQNCSHSTIFQKDLASDICLCSPPPALLYDWQVELKRVDSNLNSDRRLYCWPVRRRACLLYACQENYHHGKRHPPGKENQGRQRSGPLLTLRVSQQQGPLPRGAKGKNIRFSHNLAARKLHFLLLCNMSLSFPPICKLDAMPDQHKILRGSFFYFGASDYLLKLTCAFYSAWGIL